MSNSTMITRFAPSPTGSLHIGGARTALYNWIFAKANKGKFILRIEDTDTLRSTQKAIDEITESLSWLGLDWDEGLDVGGPNEPYRQTKRLDIYRQAVDKLITEGVAYKCFCTPEELKNEREEARRKKIPLMYSKKCRNLSAGEIKAKEEKGLVPSIRFAVPESGSTSFNDIIRGTVEFQNITINDFILVRQNGIPTYNLAVSVDDLKMAVTHVIRGEDHISNTPKQIMIMRVLNGVVPAYAHLPLIVGPDRQPLSKRHGATSVEEFRSIGYMKEALINYLALLGWSYDDKTTFFSTDDLVDKFSLDKISKSPAMIDFVKLEWMNGHYIRNTDIGELTSRIIDYLKYKGVYQFYVGEGKPSIGQAVGIVQEKMKTFSEFIVLNDFLFIKRKLGPEVIEILNGIPAVKEILRAACTALDSVTDYNASSIEIALKDTLTGRGFKPKPFFQAIRVAISGKKVTAGLFESLELLTKKQSLELINETVEIL